MGILDLVARQSVRNKSTLLLLISLCNTLMKCKHIKRPGSWLTSYHPYTSTSSTEPHGNSNLISYVFFILSIYRRTFRTIPCILFFFWYHCKWEFLLHFLSVKLQDTKSTYKNQVFFYSNNKLSEKDIFILLFIIRFLERERYTFSQFILYLYLYFFNNCFKTISDHHAPISKGILWFSFYLIIHKMPKTEYNSFLETCFL